MHSIDDAIGSVLAAWPGISEDCRVVLGSELHYQAMIYHRLRTDGQVPITQIGMNVPMYLANPITQYFMDRIEKRMERKNAYDLQNGVAPTPDVVLFRPEIDGDWRRRNSDLTLRHTLIAIEVKVSERSGSRLSSKEILSDIEKLSAHREEVRHLGADMLPIMMILEPAPAKSERMTGRTFHEYMKYARINQVEVLHCSRQDQCLVNTLGG